MKKIFFIISILLFTINVNAYENNIYKIEIPDKYKESAVENNTMKWTKDNDYIAISYSSNKKYKYNIKSFKEEDVQKQKEKIENKLNSELGKYNIKANVNNIQINNINDFYYLEYDVYYPTKDVIGYDIYQKARMYTTNSYIITSIYNCEKEIKDEEYKKIIDTLEIKDNPIVSPRVSGKKVMILSAIIAGVLVVLNTLMEKKRRK